MASGDTGAEFLVLSQSMFAAEAIVIYQIVFSFEFYGIGIMWL